MVAVHRLSKRQRWKNKAGSALELSYVRLRVSFDLKWRFSQTEGHFGDTWMEQRVISAKGQFGGCDLRANVTNGSSLLRYRQLE